jgi:hypothetical protein
MVTWSALATTSTLLVTGTEALMLFFAAVTCAVLERCRVSPRLFAATWTRVDCCAVLAWCVYSFLPTLSAMPFILVRAQQGTQADMQMQGSFFVSRSCRLVSNAALTWLVISTALFSDDRTQCR